MLDAWSVVLSLIVQSKADLRMLLPAFRERSSFLSTSVVLDVFTYSPAPAGFGCHRIHHQTVASGQFRSPTFTFTQINE